MIEVGVEGLGQLRAFLGEIRDNLVNSETLDAMAEAARRGVLERTGAGRDVHGAPFKPYSKAYGKARQKRGLSGRRVDLKRTGKMLGDIVAGASGEKGQAAVSFSHGESALKAGFHQRGKVVRDFFGVDAAGRDEIAKTLEEHIGEVIRDAY